MDIELYKKLLAHRSHSKSKAQFEFRDWLKEYIESNYTVQSKIDKYGNLYITKGNTDIYNCVIAHLDINQKTKTDDFFISQQGQWIVGINNKDGQQIGLGHDDKIGVYFAIKCLSEFENIKLFFPLDEEVGLIGTHNRNQKFWDDVGFNVQLDRRGHKDVSESTNGYQVLSEDFKKEIKDLMFKHKMGFAHCICTDVGEIVGESGIQGCNISCGYMNEHTDSEVLNVNWYKNSEEFALNLLRYTEGKKYNIAQITSYKYHYHNPKRYSYWEDDFYSDLYLDYDNNETELDSESWYRNGGFETYVYLDRKEHEVRDFFKNLDDFLRNNTSIKDEDLMLYYERMQIELEELIYEWGYSGLKFIYDKIITNKNLLTKIIK